MRIMVGDIVSQIEANHFDVIIQGCNCQCTMGAGVAKVLADKWPSIRSTDLATRRGDSSKLGKYSTTYLNINGRDVCIINAYIQDHYGTGRKHFNSIALRRVLREVAFNFAGKRIGYPAIGSGLGGGDWEEISAILDQELDGEDHTLIQLPVSKNIEMSNIMTK